MKQESKRWLSRALVVAALLGVGVLVWQVSRPTGLGEGFASGNGRIEATEVDVAAKLPGRVAEIKVDEGDFVKAGEIVARMDTQVLEAQLAQAQAQVRQAENAKLTATSLVAQRESEKSTAQAVVAQRQAELTAAQKRFTRTEALVKRNALPQQQLDDDRATLQSAQAALSAARSQVISAQAAIEAGRSQVSRRSRPSRRPRPASPGSRRISTTACSRRRATAACSTAWHSRGKCCRPVASSSTWSTRPTST